MSVANKRPKVKRQVYFKTWILMSWYLREHKTQTINKEKVCDTVKWDINGKRKRERERARVSEWAKERSGQSDKKNAGGCAYVCVYGKERNVEGDNRKEKTQVDIEETT